METWRLHGDRDAGDRLKYPEKCFFDCAHSSYLDSQRRTNRPVRLLFEADERDRGDHRGVPVNTINCNDGV